MTDSEKAAEEIIAWLRQHDYLPGMPCDEETGIFIRIRQLIDKHLC